MNLAGEDVLNLLVILASIQVFDFREAKVLEKAVCAIKAFVRVVDVRYAC